MSVAENATGLSVRTVRLPAEIDLANCDAWLETLTAALDRCDVLIVDCRTLRFLDSSGAGMLLAARDAAVERECAMRLTGLGDLPRRVLQMLGLIDLFIYSS